MFSFQSKSRHQRSKSAQKNPSSSLEQRLFGSPQTAPAQREAGASDWHKSSSELRDGCEVTQDIDLATLPPEWAGLFPPAA